MDPPLQRTFKRNAHINYFLRCLRILPSSAEGHDSNRITIAYFCISALDLLGALQQKTTEDERNGWKEWIWSLQTPTGGFRGSTFMTTSNPKTSPVHLPSTYTALLTLGLLRDDFARLDRAGLSSFLRSCQGPDGSFSPLPRNEESVDFQSDLRMTYCAAVISDLMQDQTALSVVTATRYIGDCRTWEGAYASRSGVIEAQGGTTYCASASLSLLSCDIPYPDSLIRWCVQRQIGGFQGRPGKLEDVCYSFWIGATLQILGRADLVDAEANTAFLLSAQSPLGGFGKAPDDYPDPYHSYLALAALSMSSSHGSELGLRQLDARWNVSVETAQYCKKRLHR